MVCAAVNAVKVSVLQWNERLQNIQESHGLFMVQFINGTTRPSSEKEDGYQVSEFESTSLSSPHSIGLLVSQSMEDFLNFEDDKRKRSRLTKAVSDYLLKYFRINGEVQRQKPRIVIVVDLHVSKTRNYGTRSKVVHQSKVAGRGVDLKLAAPCKCVPGELSSQDIKKIRGILMSVLKEPIVLWVRPLVSYERRGIYQVQEQLHRNDDELQIDDLQMDDACSVC